MVRSLVTLGFVLLAVLPAAAQVTCNLELEVTCSTGAQGAVCTAVTTNRGADCSGAFHSGWIASAGNDLSVTMSEPTTSMTMSCSADFVPGQAECTADNLVLKAGAKLTSKVTVNAARDVSLLATTRVGALAYGRERGSAAAFADARFPTCTPSITAPPVTQHGVDYTVAWSPVIDGSAQYTIEESTFPDFGRDVKTAQVNGLSKTFVHDNLLEAETYYYRVRPTHCAGGVAEFSSTAETVVQAPVFVDARSAGVTVPVGSDDRTSFIIRIPWPGHVGSGAPLGYTVSTDQPFLSVNVKEGLFTTSGANVRVTADPESLQPGTNSGTLTLALTLTDATGAKVPAGTIDVPVSIHVAPPVGTSMKTNPYDGTLIIPVVTHVNGISSPFLSDVRLTNPASTPRMYAITMTSTRDRTTSSRTMRVSVEKEETLALDDIVSNYFGFGATANPDDFGFGSLEIRPIRHSTPLYAASRTYASTAGGTFGQYIPALPYSRFMRRPAVVGDEPSLVQSLQHVSQSTRFRTNLGLAEGAGQRASVRVRFFDRIGTLVKEVPIELRAGEMRQDNIAFYPYEVPAFEDGRIEVVLTSFSGAVAAYASVIDNRTSDPLAVMPVSPNRISTKRVVLPGIAELPPPARQNFHSDVRLFNGGTFDLQVTPTFYPQGGGAPKTVAARTVRAGEVAAFDNILPTLFNLSNTGGSVVFTTNAAAPLVATARTYTTVANGGSFGQFIPGVTPAEGTGRGERPLQLLQLEQSSRFRSNVGLTELTGNPVTVRLRMYRNNRVEVRDVPLKANEFVQFQPLPTPAYNARISVEVIEGSGRVTAYGSVIDNRSLDPTYVPAQ